MFNLKTNVTTATAAHHAGSLAGAPVWLHSRHLPLGKGNASGDGDES